MKAWSRLLAALALSLSLLLSSLPYGGRAAVRPLPKNHSSSSSSSATRSISTAPSSKAIKDLQANRKNPHKEVQSSIRLLQEELSSEIFDSV
ncbi:hypothetical protein FNV43_RR08044 [Rhamnella rubrinervis]|uniref:Uncharacterized protein n=1 Tax=Rhamnella rubrinervis TaxID=2594499 RepID=A0A8K0HHT9_9ROSA|nr:hypothetical protein FNV43_RR08044 [Rhamnella rubrinervis]